MNVIETIQDIRRAVAPARAEGKSVGFVPTMGALHEGHRALIRRAREQCDFVVVSIFVNPTQFGPNEDFEKYPRRREDDLAACEELGVDAVFAPSAEEMYPGGTENCLASVSVEALGDTLCGRNRPGHFEGVATVVTKLFHVVSPDVAYFGRKDFQQAVIIRRLVADLNFPIRIEVCPTVREEDGLAMSSRNAYLSEDQRRQARHLYGALQQAEAWVLREHPPAEAVIEHIRRYLSENAPYGQVDYIQLVNPDTLADVTTTDDAFVAALAVKFGRTRLIDNLPIEP
jgi:pantoate--beta-alanine ligase